MLKELFSRKVLPEEAFQLKFSTRMGNENEYVRLLTIQHPDGKPRDYLMQMQKVAGERLGRIFALLRGDDGVLLSDEAGNLQLGKVLWEGKLRDAGPPTRAFAVAAKLCGEDEKGNAFYTIPLPRWAK